MIRPTHRRHRACRGFTLAEILVVIAILALLAAITVYAIGKARKGADKARLGFQLQAISAGLEAYQTDFNALPVTNQLPNTVPMSDPRYYIDREGVRGARLLCKALMGQCGGMNPVIATAGVTFPLDKPHQDGKVGLGFAVPGRSGLAITVDTLGNLKGKTYGPYLAVDKFPMSNTNDEGKLVSTSLNPAEKYDDTAVLLDGNGNPILYWPCLNPQAPIGITYGYIQQGRVPAAGATGSAPGDPLETGTPFAGTPMYAGLDNAAWIAAPTFRKLMGDLGDNNVASTAGDGKITGTEVTAVRGKYILWSSGPDGLFGPQLRNGQFTLEQAIKRADLYDDVTNFQGE